MFAFVGTNKFEHASFKFGEHSYCVHRR